MSTYRLLFLGAGFSSHAGLPLGSKLFKEIRRKIISDYSSDNHVESDLKRFMDYLANCFGRVLLPDEVDLEEFLGFLDIEHYLGLKGKDTWSSEGNESQLMIRKAIGQVIYSLTPTGPDIPDAYRRFVSQLTSTDYILTFNYDTLLENALELEGIPYRLFPHPYSEVYPQSCIIDSDRDEEVVLLKLHGSIDWFSKSGFDEMEEIRRQNIHIYPKNHQTSHPIFGYDAMVTPTPLTYGPRLADESLNSIYRVRDLNVVSACPFWKSSPFILSPSNAKLFYAKPLLEFWRGLQRGGGLNLSLGIIGYSLPSYDDYALQAMYSIARNYLFVEQSLEFKGRRKTKIRIVDYQNTRKSEDAFRKRYQFLDWSRTEVLFSGFNESTVDWILR